MSSAECAACRFYKPTMHHCGPQPGQLINYAGECHLMPPHLHQRGDAISRQTCWPVVQRWDWCGAHKEKPDAPPGKHGESGSVTP